MQLKIFLGAGIAGALAGAVNGLFGAGGGMVLVPLLSATARLEDDQVFPASVSVILPVCIVSLLVTCHAAPLPWAKALPYLLGSGIGGVLAGFFGNRLPVKWLHRFLGLLILWGGVRYLC